MSYTIKLSGYFEKTFKRLSKKYRSLESDVSNLVSELLVNPYQGADLGGGVRKVRMPIASKGKGKSGGARVITYTVIIDEQNGSIVLLAIYDKSEQDSISHKKIEQLLDKLKEEI